MTNHLLKVALFCAAAGAVLAQTSSSTYVPGVTYQKTNPNYPTPNPFWFEGRIDWNLLNITEPNNPWEFMQRGIHKQDDLEDNAGAIADYQKSISMNNLGNNTCQLVTTAPKTGNVNPPPCIFTVRLRLAGLLRNSDPQQAIGLYQQVLNIDPLRLGVNGAIGETYKSWAEATSDPVKKQGLYQNAIAAFQAELALSPVTALETQLTTDTANNAHVHWSLAEMYRALNDPMHEANEDRKSVV